MVDVGDAIMNVRRTIPFLVAAALTSPVVAGTIGYRVFQSGTLVDSGTLTVSNNAPYTNVEIPLGTITINTDVHIFDFVNGTDPADSAGVITLRGLVSPGMPVRVLVGNSR